MNIDAGKALLIVTPGGCYLHRDKTCPEIRDWVGLNTSPYVSVIPAPAAKAGYKVCGKCLPARRLAGNWRHEYSAEPDARYPHLVRGHCSCGWATAGYVKPWLAENRHADHAA